MSSLFENVERKSTSQPPAHSDMHHTKNLSRSIATLNVFIK